MTRSLSVAALALVTHAGLAKTITVRLFPGDAPTIQAAIDRAANGDEILVAGGTYTENLDLGPKELRIQALGTAVVAPAAAGPTVRIAGGQTQATELYGLTIRGGAGAVGGALLIENSSPSLFLCTIRDGVATDGPATDDGRGGGVAVLGASAPAFTLCTFTENEAALQGGAVFIGSGASAAFSVCTFVENRCGFSGGAVQVLGGAATFTACTFARNSAGPDYALGGAVAVGDGSEAALIACAFSGNTAQTFGGAVYAQYSALGLTDCTFEDNVSHQTGGDIAASGGSLTVEGCAFTGGWASNSGGSIYASSTDGLTIAGSAFDGAYSDNSGGSLYLTHCPDARIADTTFSHSTARISGGALSASNCGLALRNVDFDSCRASSAIGRGGAVLVQDTSLAASGCTFAGCEAGSSAGAVSVTGGSATLERCTFERSAAVLWGAAVDASGLDGLSVRGCLFRDNACTASGAGAIRTSDASPVSIVSTDFIGNAAAEGTGAIDSTGDDVSILSCRFVANTTGGRGGAVRMTEGNLLLANSLFAGNSAAHGGAIDLAETPFTIGEAGIVNCTFVGNAASGEGGAVRVGRYTSAPSWNATVRSSLFWENGDDIFSGAIPVDLAYTLTLDDEYAAAPGVVRRAPLFADPDGPDGDPSTPEDNDYRPAPGSPVIDAGDTGALPPDLADLDEDEDFEEVLPLDLAGGSRRLDDAGVADTGAGGPPVVDIGAHEFQGVSPPSCPADVDEDLAVTVNDLLAFLGAFRGGSADHDGDGDTDVQDLLAFLGAFRSGC